MADPVAIVKQLHAAKAYVRVYTFSGGKIVRVRNYYDTAAYVDALRTGSLNRAQSSSSSSFSGSAKAMIASPTLPASGSTMLKLFRSGTLPPKAYATNSRPPAT